MPEKTLRSAIQDVANAIRAKAGTSETMTIEEMPTNISNISTPEGTYYITDNGGYDITEYAYVDVDVTSGPAETGNYTMYNGNLTQNEILRTDSDYYLFDSYNFPELQQFEDTHIYQYDSTNGFTDQQAYERGNYTFYEDELCLNDTSSDGVYYFDWNNMPQPKSLDNGHTYYYNGGSEFSDMGELDPGIYSIYDHYASEIYLDESKLYRSYIGSGPIELKEEEWYNDMLELEVGGSVSFTVEDSLGNQYSFTATRTA